jgi:hypothetical protein
MVSGFVYNCGTGVTSLHYFCNGLTSNAFGYLHGGIEQLIGALRFLSEYSFQW